MSLFDGFKRKAVQQEMTQKEQTPNNPPAQDDSEGFYFESPIEFTLYVELVSEKNVIWLSGDNYWNEYKKGYQLYEAGRYEKAIEAYKKCLDLNPIGLSARFEICESYLKLGNLNAAKRTLREMRFFLIEKEKIAKFYRRIGFIEIENGNYDIAAACYLYSRKFEDHPSVNQELMYIKSKSGISNVSGDLETILMRADVPILTTKPFG